MRVMVNDLAEAIAREWRLTSREFEVLREILRGNLTTKDISRSLQMTGSTLGKHIDAISRKSGLSGRTELASFLLEGFARFLESIRDLRHGLDAPISATVLDDDEDIAFGISEFMRRSGIAADATTSVADTIRKNISDDRSDLVIVDFVLPELDGLTVIESIRASGEGAPEAILMTGFPDRLSIAQGQVARTVLLKPLDLELLTATARSVATSGRLRRLLISAFRR